MDIIKIPSPNFNERANNQNPSIIVIHYTGTKTADEARTRFCDPNPTDNIGRISPHYLIGDKGVVWQLVDEEKRAWHAGKSSWGNVMDVNSASIGIEIWNTGHEYDFEDFQDAQINALTELLRGIIKRWNILPHNIVGHSDIACGRKLDPGEKFPWQKLNDAGIGLMPRANGAAINRGEFFNCLKQYGYTYTDNHEILLREFRRHFLPHRLNAGGVDDMDCAAIASLLNQW